MTAISELVCDPDMTSTIDFLMGLCPPISHYHFGEYFDQCFG